MTKTVMATFSEVTMLIVFIRAVFASLRQDHPWLKALLLYL